MPTVLKTPTLMFMIHTRDHGHPHVTIYKGTPDAHEAFAKIRLDVIQVIEHKGFSTKALALLTGQALKYQADWLEVWNETRPE